MSVSVADLTAGYRKKIENIQSMISAIPDELKGIFGKAMNIYDEVRRTKDTDSYIAYGMKALALLGWWYDAKNGAWVSAGAPIMTGDQLRELYKGSDDTLCKDLGVSCWMIIDANVDIDMVQKAGEMEGSLEMALAFDGEQNKTDVIQIPDIPISPNADIAEMTKGDSSSDKFIYAYSDSGISKNKRNWRPIIMDSIASQVMEHMPPGHYGHMKPGDVGYAFPNPAVTWIGATTESLSDDTKRLWLKGYIIPLEEGNNLKTYIRAKAVDSISVWGGLTLLPNEETGIADVLDIDLKSIDISGKLKEGLHSSIVKVAGEMQAPSDDKPKPPDSEDENKPKGDNNTMDRSEIIRGLSMADLEAGNPGLMATMRQSIVDSLNVEAKNKAMLTAAGEMETIEKMVGYHGEQAVEQVKSFKTFTGEMEAVLGMEAGSPLSAIIDKVKSAVADSGVVQKLTEMVTPKQGQDVIARTQELVDADRIAKNTAAIASVTKKFDELTADVTNDVIKDMIRDSFESVLTAKPESVGADFATTAVNDMTARMPGVKQKVMTRAQSLMQTGRAAGEMAMFDSLGIGQGAGGKDSSQMSDEEYAKSLGYGV